jgi:hypothetical protein
VQAHHQGHFTPPPHCVACWDSVWAMTLGLGNACKFMLHHTHHQHHCIGMHAHAFACHMYIYDIPIGVARFSHKTHVMEKPSNSNTGSAK